MIFGTAIGSKIFNVEKICVKKFGVSKTKQLMKRTGPKKLYICGKNEDTLSYFSSDFSSFLHSSRGSAPQ